MTNDTTEARFEIVSEGDGFGVRRVGEPGSISYHSTREEAEQAARLHSREGAEVDARKDVFAGPGEDGDGARRTFTTAGIFALAVVLLIVVVSLIVALG